MNTNTTHDAKPDRDIDCTAYVTWKDEHGQKQYEEISVFNGVTIPGDGDDLYDDGDEDKAGNFGIPKELV